MRSLLERHPVPLEKITSCIEIVDEEADVPEPSYLTLVLVVAIVIAEHAWRKLINTERRRVCEASTPEASIVFRSVVVCQLQNRLKHHLHVSTRRNTA